MGTLQQTKYAASFSAAVLAPIFTKIFGPWSYDLTALCILMAIDMVTGVCCAAFFNSSPKTRDGAISSRKFKEGIVRKIATFVYIAAAYQVDMVLGWDSLKVAATYAFITYEFISIVENAGLMGIPLPPIFYDAIEVLKEKGGYKDKEEEAIENTKEIEG